MISKIQKIKHFKYFLNLYRNIFSNLQILLKATFSPKLQNPVSFQNQKIHFMKSEGVFERNVRMSEFFVNLIFFISQNCLGHHFFSFVQSLSPDKILCPQKWNVLLFVNQSDLFQVPLSPVHSQELFAAV